VSVFRQIVFAAALSGLIAGILMAIAHAVGTVPIIRQAELYEKAAAADGTVVGATVTSASPAHDHDAGGWEPADGLERTAYTVTFDVLAAIGFALLLTSAYALSGRDIGWRRGLLWGAAGFVAFMLAPALGLRPEIPGAESAPLLDRQVWWLGTVAATGGGLALIFLLRKWPWIAFGVLLILLPHLIGAPQPAREGSLAPARLAHEFVLAALLSGLLFWLALGALSGFFYKRFTAA
jgi:cobalt transporter subunit CbtA